MFFKDFQGWAQDQSNTLSVRCPNCGNTCDHYIYVAPYGIQIGVIFMKRPLLSLKKYFLLCSTCDFVNREISKQQAESMRRKL